MGAPKKKAGTSSGLTLTNAGEHRTNSGIHIVQEDDDLKDDNMIETSDEDLSLDGLSLDLDNEFVKEAKKSSSKTGTKKIITKKSNADSTLVGIQNVVQGEEVEAEQEDEMEIVPEDGTGVHKALLQDPIFTNKGDQYPQIHGSYFLLDHLVDGGMAKICRARYIGEGDQVDKMVVIKMVQEKFSEDEEFVSMFIDEIKVSFGLQHPNISTTFDYGKIGKNLFVSMEYIHGKDLMVLIDKLKEEKKTIPVPMALFITSKMCEALHYAHNFTNQLTGQKYNIVHRDISPHNVMVSYEGFVKVIDFGIAKADTNSQKEEEGTVKGKINYFAPEYLEGKPINHTYDQFAVALSLWEMLTGEKTFNAGEQLATLKLILACNPEKPSIHNQDVPEELDEILLKALSKNPEDRYADMLAFNKDLLKLLYTKYPEFHESDISSLIKELFNDSFEKDQETFKGFGEYKIEDIASKVKALKEYMAAKKSTGGGTMTASAVGGDEVTFDFGFGEEETSALGKSDFKSMVAVDRTSKSKKKKGFDPNKKNAQQERFMALLDDDKKNRGGESVKASNPVNILVGILLMGALAYWQWPMLKKQIDSLTGEEDPFAKVGYKEKSPQEKDDSHNLFQKDISEIVGKNKKSAKLRPKKVVKKVLKKRNIPRPVPQIVQKAASVPSVTRPVTRQQDQQVSKPIASPKKPTSPIVENTISEQEVIEETQKLKSLEKPVVENKKEVIKTPVIKFIEPEKVVKTQVKEKKEIVETPKTPEETIKKNQVEEVPPKEMTNKEVEESWEELKSFDIEEVTLNEEVNKKEVEKVEEKAFDLGIPLGRPAMWRLVKDINQSQEIKLQAARKIASDWEQKKLITENLNRLKSLEEEESELSVEKESFLVKLGNWLRNRRFYQLIFN